MDFTQIIASIVPYIPVGWVPYVTAIVTIAAALATFLPKIMDESSTAYKIIRSIVDGLAFNFGNAKNSK